MPATLARRALAGWAPAKLVDLPRERITPLPDVGIVDARYVAGSIDVHVNFSLPSDGAAARAFYETARPPYRVAKIGTFTVWVRASQADDGRKFADACTIVQDRLSLCVSLLPGEGDQALPYLEALDLRAMDRWADPTPPEERRDSELIRKTLLGAATDHNEARRVSMPFWSSHRVYKLTNYTQPHIPGCYVAIGPGDRILPLAGEGDRVATADPVANYNEAAASEPPIHPDNARYHVSFFLRAYFADIDWNKVEPREIAPTELPNRSGWQFDFRYPAGKTARSYHLTLAPNGRVTFRRD